MVISIRYISNFIHSMKTQTQTEENALEPTSRPNIFLMLSGALFAIVCAVSLFFFFENSSLARAIDGGKAEIAGYTSSIEKIKSDSNIIRSELVENNKPELVNTIKQGEAQRYVTELQNIAMKYKMMFSGFSYANGKVSTAAVSIPERVLA